MTRCPLCGGDGHPGLFAFACTSRGCQNYVEPPPAPRAETGPQEKTEWTYDWLKDPLLNGMYYKVAREAYRRRLAQRARSAEQQYRLNDELQSVSRETRGA